MIGKSAIKVKGGKLLKVCVEHQADKILNVKFSGDFFIYPEDALERLEERLKGAKLNGVRDIVAEELADARLYGVDAGTMVKAVWEAFG